VAFCPAQMLACMDCESSKQFGSRKDDEIGCGKTKSARECSLDKIEVLDGAHHDLPKAFNLALGLKINDDPRFVRTPFF
jgi:hypothetical protein